MQWCVWWHHWFCWIVKFDIALSPGDKWMQTKLKHTKMENCFLCASVHLFVLTKSWQCSSFSFGVVASLETFFCSSSVWHLFGLQSFNVKAHIGHQVQHMLQQTNGCVQHFPQIPVGVCLHEWSTTNIAEIKQPTKKIRAFFSFLLIEKSLDLTFATLISPLEA